MKKHFNPNYISLDEFVSGDLAYAQVIINEVCYDKITLNWSYINHDVINLRVLKECNYWIGTSSKFYSILGPNFISCIEQIKQEVYNEYRSVIIQTYRGEPLMSISGKIYNAHYAGGALNCDREKWKYYSPLYPAIYDIKCGIFHMF